MSITTAETSPYKGLTNGELFYNNYYAMNSQGGLQRAKSPEATLAPQRWYLKIENKDGSPMKDDEYFAAEVRVLGASDDEEVTGISDMETQSVETESATYRLLLAEVHRATGNKGKFQKTLELAKSVAVYPFHKKMIGEVEK